MNKRTPVHPKPHLLSFERRPQTDQQRVAGEFLARVGEIENFVILAQTKDGKIILFPCVDADPGVALFIDICKAKIVKEAAHLMGQDVVEQSAPQI
jgi:hypothetical protein